MIESVEKKMMKKRGQHAPIVQVNTMADTSIQPQLTTTVDTSIQAETDRSKAVLLLWIFYVFARSSVCNVFVRLCLYVLCGQLLGKG